MSKPCGNGVCAEKSLRVIRSEPAAGECRMNQMRAGKIGAQSMLELYEDSGACVNSRLCNDRPC
jgi:hypothetical protein